MTTTELSNKELAFLAHLESKMQDMDLLAGGLQAIVYGDSGVGKTVAAMLLAAEITPAEKIILHIDTAQGYKVRKNHDRLMQRKFHRIQFTSIADLMKIADLVDKGAGFLGSVGAVIFDESTTMAAEDLQVVLGQRSQFKDPGKDPNALTLPDFGQAQQRFTNLVSKFAKLNGVHCIHIGHVRTDTTPSGGVAYSPSYTPKLGAVLRQPMDLVTYMTINEENARVFRNHPMKGIVAKSRVKDLAPQTGFGELVKRTTEWLESEKAEPDETNEITPMDTEEMEI